MLNGVLQVKTTERTALFCRSHWGKALNGNSPPKCGCLIMDVWESGIQLGNILPTLLITLVLVIGALKAHILDSKGIFAAAILGLLVGGLGHWTWLLILLGFLLSSHKATKYRFEEKKARGMSESSDGSRGWGNVVANGGLPLVVAIFAFYFQSWQAGLWVFSASVAVAASDTWASEIGCLDDRVRMITTFKPCEAGINGGFSPNGQLAAAGGSTFVAILAFIAGLLTTDFSTDILVSWSLFVALIGWLGCQIDSYLGAILENRGFLTKGSVNALSITAGLLITAVYVGFP